MSGLGWVVLLGFAMVAPGVATIGMELRKRKDVPANNDGSDSSDLKSENSGSSNSFDETEEEVLKEEEEEEEEATRSKTKRKRSERPIPKKKKESTIHICRFCEAIFTQSQALGGHMNRHRTEKDKEAMENAQRLVQSKTEYARWSMEGHPGYNNFGGPPYMSNSNAGQLGGVYYQSQLGGGGYYNPVDNGRPPHYHQIPPQRDSTMNPSTPYNSFPLQRDNTAPIYPPPPLQGQGLQQRPVVHGHETDMMQHHGHHNPNIQAPESLLNMLSSPPFPTDYSTMRQSHKSHFVDEHGNASRDFESGQMGRVKFEHHHRVTGEVVFQSGPSTFQDESESTLMEPGQASFDDTGASVDADASKNLL